MLGCVLGCLGPAASMAAAMSHKQPFVAPMDKRDEAEKARRSMADKGKLCRGAGECTNTHKNVHTPRCGTRGTERDGSTARNEKNSCALRANRLEKVFTCLNQGK